jgi:hypothetical protein
LKYLGFILRLSMIVIALGFQEVLGATPREWEEQALAHLRESAEAAGDSFAFATPAVVSEKGPPLLGLERIRQELDLLGFDCTEVHQGMETLSRSLLK